MGSFLVVLACFIALNTATPQSANGPNERSHLTYDQTLGSYDFSWWGKPGRTYFIQQSDDLLSWEYVPLIESGGDDALAWTFTSNKPKFFLRLQHSDIPTTDPFAADFDSDHVGNLDEVQQGTDPLHFADSDGDGLADDWEYKHFGPLPSGPGDDPDGDGLTNLQEYTYYSDPMDFGNRAGSTFGDSDHNGLDDWWEILYFGHLGNDPNQAVALKDGLTLKQIFDHDLDLTASSTVGDDIPDGWKIAHGLDAAHSNLMNEDVDGDGLTNGDEFDAGTNPQGAAGWDTDGDGIPDGSDLYPLIPNPSPAQNVRVAVPSVDEPEDPPQPDYTKVELRWDAALNGPTGYRVERRADSDVWQLLATVSAGTRTHSDDSLLASRHYEYRVTALKDAGGQHLEAEAASAEYRVPLNVRLLVKRAYISRWKDGDTEFVDPSTPPKYYLARTETANFSTLESHGESSRSTDQTLSLTTTIIPAPHGISEVGSYDRVEVYHEDLFEYTETEHEWSTYYMQVTGRSKGNLTCISIGSEDGGYTRTVEQDGTTWMGSDSDSGAFHLETTYQPYGENAIWMGENFDLTKGSLAYSGSSTYDAFVGEDGSNTTYVDRSTCASNGEWTGTRHWSRPAGDAYPADQDTYPISDPAWDEGAWYRNRAMVAGDTMDRPRWSGTGGGWYIYERDFFGVLSTTPTTRVFRDGIVTLSQEYATDDFVTDVLNDLPDYPEEWDADFMWWSTYGWGYSMWGAWYPDYPGSGWLLAERDLSVNEDRFAIGKVTYKFTANPSANKTVHWYEVFVPEDDPSTEDVDESTQVEILAERTWTLTGGQNESEEYEIAEAVDDPREGHYTILFEPVHIGVAGIGEAGKDVAGQDSAPGKVVLINDGDADSDGIVDYADGFDLNNQIADDDTCAGAAFTRIDISFVSFDSENAKVKFTYDASNPKAVSSSGTNRYVLPNTGKVRLWTKDASSARNADTVKQGGDYVQPGVEYSLEDFGIGTDASSLTLYVEAVKVSDAVADIPIKVEVDPDGASGFVWSDQLRFTNVNYHFEATGYQSAETFVVNHLVPSDVLNFDAWVARYGLTPSSYGLYRIAVEDPRANINAVRLNNIPIPVTRQGASLKSDSFVCLRPGSVGKPQPAGQTALLIPVAGDFAHLEWNPDEQPPVKPRLKRLTGPDNDLSKFIGEVSEEMKNANSQLTGADFGRDFEARVTVKVKAVNDGRWLQSVRVHNETNEIMSLDRNLTPTTSPPINNTTEIDFVRLKRGHNMKVGDIWDMSKAEFIHELKGSVSGTLTRDQYERLVRLAGDDTQKLLVHQPKWINTGTGWIEPPRYKYTGYILKSLVIGGAAWGLYTMPANASEALDGFQAAHENYLNAPGNYYWKTEMKRLRSAYLDAVVLEPASRFLIQIEERDEWIDDLTTYINTH